MNERVRTAWHEAGHAVADLAFGHDLLVVSIRPTERYAGVCRAQVDLGAHRLAMTTVVPDQDAGLRATVERQIIAALAGAAAEWMTPMDGKPARYSTPPCEAQAEALVMRLPPRERELLRELETSRSPGMSDDARSLEIASAFTGSDQAIAYWNWLRAATRDFVEGRRLHIERVADALLERSVLTGEEVAAICRVPW